jgi:hypothetical protein
MSWLEDLGGVVSGVVDFFKGGSVASNLAKTALLGYGVNKITNSINRQNQTPEQTRTPEIDKGVRLQVDPDPNTRIPVVYGTAQLSGIITDAELADSNKTLYLVFTLSETTGTKLSDNLPSSMSFGQIYINDQRIVWGSGPAGGLTVAYTVDREGNVDNSLAGLVTVYCYAGSSAAANNVAPTGFSLSSTATAYDVMPSWTSTAMMNNLAFVVVKMTYSSEKNLTRIPTIRVQLTNSMTKPGDVVYDYMTNTRYGAGIDPSEIYSA